VLNNHNIKPPRPCVVAQSFAPLKF